MRTRASSAAGAALYVVLVLAILYLLVPLLAVVALSLTSQSYLTLPPEGWSTRWYARLLDNPAWASAARNSLSVGAWTALLSMILGTLAALAIGRVGFAISKTLSAAAVAPIMLPHIILAIGMYPDGRSRHDEFLGVGDRQPHGDRLAARVHHGHRRHEELQPVARACRDGARRQSVADLLEGVVSDAALRHPDRRHPGVREFVRRTGAGPVPDRPDTRTLPRLVWEQLNDFSNPSIAAVASLIMVFTLVLLGAAGLLVQGQVSRPSSRESS